MGQVTAETIKMIKASHAEGVQAPLTINEIDQLVHGWEEYQKTLPSPGNEGWAVLYKRFTSQLDALFFLLRNLRDKKLDGSAISKAIELNDVVPGLVEPNQVATIQLRIVDKRTIESPTFNQELYRDAIIAMIPDIGMDDLKWLCNKCANLYQKCDRWGEGVDNFRVARNIKGSEALARYDAIRNKGCCGFTDEEITNPLTKNEFIIGFNYGHRFRGQGETYRIYCKLRFWSPDGRLTPKSS